MILPDSNCISLTVLPVIGLTWATRWQARPAGYADIRHAAGGFTTNVTFTEDQIRGLQTR
jgi:hypothetical protein